MGNDVERCCDGDQTPPIIMKPLNVYADDTACSPTYSVVAADPTPLPRRQLYFIWLIHASQGFQTTMLFPMLVFMVEKYGDTGVDERAIGWRAGILASLFPMAQFCTSMMWGVISDKTGRKPWLAFGCSVSAVSALLLGVCTTYKGACYLRFFGGLLNGTLTITKSALADLCDGTNQAKGFGILNLAWGIGSVTGPVISGLLAQPCVQYRMKHCLPILEVHPFLLPCVGAAVFSITGVIASLSFKETNPKQYRASYNKISDLAHAEDQQRQSQEGESAHEESKGGVLANKSCKQKLIVVISTDELSSLKRMTESKACRSEECGSSTRKKEHGQHTWFSWIDRNVLLASLCYAMTGLVFIITDELFPMFGAASKSVGGLNFSSSALGLILGEGGVVLCLYTLLLYPKVSRRLGPLKCFRLGILSTIPIWICFPMSSLLNNAPFLQWCLLLFCTAARSISACTAFTGSLILVSNSATPENMGAVTGLSHSFCSFFRANGPAIGGLVWSYSSGKTFFLHQFLAWNFVVMLSALTYGLSFYLPSTLIKPKCEPFRVDENM
ncbi:probable peptide/nitrate transporter At3g43790 isoform X2 [Physcomitrium patens]|uniref:Major facilitator superfamily (MFS) profile domain-containing protein n=2 Tax=Physcomitrium patens TaxID=3218 RepID=A0A7I4D9A1_PHYPA|nr:probable peptide/nitrate transporter At3g43790 isoform X2 [Physcomitrium patens]|eukprot:XP_024370083.1 probable peptide/nitrate transporter At3g43790 isoform X2 [Physcomitrella patens]